MTHMPDETVINRAAAAFGVDCATLCGAGRTMHVAQARQAVMYALRRRGRTTTAIGRLLGRDHQTVLYGARKAEARAVADPAYARQLAELLPDRLGA